MDQLRLFVYGSLKPGEYNWHVIAEGVQTCQPARLAGKLFLRHDGYPALVLERDPAVLGSADYSADLQKTWGPGLPQGEACVEGQLLTLRPGSLWLQRLDDFEGFFPGSPSEYLRVLTSVEVSPNLCEQAWTYTAAQTPPAHWPLIEEWNRSMVEDLAPYDHGRGGEGTHPGQRQ